MILLDWQGDILLIDDAKNTRPPLLLLAHQLQEKHRVGNKAIAVESVLHQIRTKGPQKASTENWRTAKLLIFRITV